MGSFISSAPPKGDRQIFDVSGDWIKPTGFSDAAMAILEMWGGGGSGGALNRDLSHGGHGGDYKRVMIPLSELSDVEPVVIGSGGADVIARAGQKGGNTEFFGLSAIGGNGGRISTTRATDPGPEGATDQLSGVYTAENGGVTQNRINAGAAGVSFFIANPGPFTSVYGGDGGGSGQPGQSPGGGGGGNASGGRSGAGANGRLVVTVIE